MKPQFKNKTIYLESGYRAYIEYGAEIEIEDDDNKTVCSLTKNDLKKIQQAVDKIEKQDKQLSNMN